MPRAADIYTGPNIAVSDGIHVVRRRWVLKAGVFPHELYTNCSSFPCFSPCFRGTWYSTLEEGVLDAITCSCCVYNYVFLVSMTCVSLRIHILKIGRRIVTYVAIAFLADRVIGPAVGADFRRLYPANAKTLTCCPSDDNRIKVTNSVTSARSLWWHVGPYFWPADLTRTANPIVYGYSDRVAYGYSDKWRQANLN